MHLAHDIAPGPRGLPVLGNLPTFWKGESRLDVFARDVARHGDVVRYDFGPLVAQLVVHPDDVKHVVQENAVNYTKGRGTKRLRFLLGDGLLTSEGELWRRQRKLTQPAFHPKRVATLVDTMVAATREMRAGWATHAAAGTAVDVAAEMMRLTLDIVARTLFGADIKAESARVYEALTVTLDTVNRRLMLPVQIPVALPLPSNARFIAAKKTLDDLVYAIIAGRRKAHGASAPVSEGGDLLAMLMDSRDEETGLAMSDTQLRDEVMTLVLAGHETTANTLAFTWMLLSKEPVVWRKLRAEVQHVLGERTLTAADLPKLKYTRMVIEESMRLYPPASLFGRLSIAEDEVRGYRIPPGSMVILSPFLTHRHPQFWSNPEGFDPARFAPDVSALRHKHAYLPFGGGPRVCIGNAFAMSELQAVVATMTQQYRVEVLARDIELEQMVTLRPKGGMRARVHAVS